MSHEKDAGKEPPKRKNKLEQLAGEKPPEAAAVPVKKNMGKIFGAEFAATSAANLGEKRERSPRSQADVPQRSKLARLGIPESAAKTSEESPRADSSGPKKSKQERILGDTSAETFVDPNYTESKSTVNLASVIIGKIICSVILTDRPTIPDETFKQNLTVVSQLAGNPKHSPLTLITEDGARVSGLKVEADPPTTKTIIAFQGQKGNFQDQQQLERVFEIARETGCNVVAFNYRDNPSSKQHFINDALTTTNYVTDRMNVCPNDISFYGESFGGTVAAETALQLKNNSEKEVKVVLFRTPKSLADAVKMIDLEALLKKPVIALLQEIKTKIGETQLVKYILNKGINGDFEAQEAVMQLNQDNVKCVRVEGDPIIHKKANIEHKNMSVCTTKEDDKHNASPSSLSDRSTKWVRAGQNATQERQNGFDLLREHSNPGFKQQQQVVSVAKK